jgi:hypothetical protein
LFSEATNFFGDDAFVRFLLLLKVRKTEGFLFDQVNRMFDVALKFEGDDP